MPFLAFDFANFYRVPLSLFRTQRMQFTIRIFPPLNIATENAFTGLIQAKKSHGVSESLIYSQCHYFSTTLSKIFGNEEDI